MLAISRRRGSAVAAAASNNVETIIVHTCVQRIHLLPHFSDCATDNE
jgi:hypothetical protein